MSIEHMSAVWKDDYYTQGDKAKLLVALAIADTANGDGFAFPSIDFIAKKARTSARGVQELCRELEQDGKIEVQVGKGRNGTNLYRLLGVSLVHPRDGASRVNGAGQVQGGPISPRNGAAAKAADEAPLGCTQTIRNGKEPSKTPILKKGEKQTPTSSEALRMAALFHRRPNTKWHDDEIRAFKKLVPIEPEELSLVERFYQDSGNEFLRTSLQTFLNNFRTEVDKARCWSNPKPVNGTKPTRMFLTE